MDPLTVLRREHTRIGQLFVEFDALAQRACNGRKALMREIDELVRRHVEMEKALNYQRTAPEHETVLAMLDQIAQTECRSDLYVARAHALRDMLLDHIAGTHAA
jgi:hypothetical protein